MLDKMNELIPRNDLRVEVWPPARQGGQTVGTHTGVRVTHIPTGIQAIVDCHRSQHRNKNIATDMILGALTSPHWRL